MRWVIRHRFTEEDVSMARRFDQNKCSIDELNSISKYTVLYSVCPCVYVCVCVCVCGGGGTLLFFGADVQVNTNIHTYALCS